MNNKPWSKPFKSKSGRKFSLRYIHEDDAQRLVDFINPIVDEDTFIILNEHQSLEKEYTYIQECIQKMSVGNLLKIVAVDGDAIIGVCDVSRGRYKQSHSGTLGITVDKAYRGEGVGRSLMTEALNQSREMLGLKLIKLSCYAENINALRLYDSLGFIEYGRLPAANFHRGLYSDRISMYKNL